MATATVRQEDSPDDFGPGAEGLASRWQAELRAAEKDRTGWLKQCMEIERRYREAKIGEGQTTTDKVRFNVLWSNIQTLKPAVYSRPPMPVVQRRFRDQDPVARAASMILQRSLSYVIEDGDVHELTKQLVDDFLLYARGTSWVRYEPHYSTPAQPGVLAAESEIDAEDPEDEGVQVTNTGDDAENENVEEPEWEEVEWDFVDRRDFFNGPGAVWAEVGWVARRVRMTRDDGVKRFGAKFKKVNLSWKPIHASDDTPEDDAVIRRAEVVELWDKSTKTVLWFGDPFGDITLLDKRDDPLTLRGFFPCPRPLFGTTTSGSLMPVPDYVEYQDQARELDDLTARIAGLTSSIKVAGAYDSRFPELARIFDEGMENQLVAIDQWIEFAQKGGMAGGISLVPMLEMIQTLQALIEARTQVKSDLYEVSGIADVIRGSTAPEETATAQRIKGRYATMRLSDRQLEVARYVRDMLRISGEIICEHFSPQTLRLVSNFDQTELGKPAPEMPPMMGHNGGPPMPMATAGVPPPQPGAGGGIPPVPPPSIFDQAVALLKNDKLRGFRIDIEDQSTIAMDDEAEKAARVQFLKSVGDYIQSAAQIPPQMAPAMLPLLGKLLLFGARAFRAGLEMETAIEDAITKLSEQAAQQAANPPPNPEMIKAQTEQQKTQAEMQMRQQEMQATMQQAQAEAQFKMQQAQAAAQDAEANRQMAAQKMQHDAAQAQAQNAQDATEHQIAIDKAMLERERFQQEQLQAERDHQIEVARLAIEQQRLELDRHKMTLDAAKAVDDSDIKREGLKVKETAE